MESMLLAVRVSGRSARAPRRDGLHCDPPSGAPQPISEAPGRKPFAGPDFLAFDRGGQRHPRPHGPPGGRAPTPPVRKRRLDPLARPLAFRRRIGYADAHMRFAPLPIAVVLLVLPAAG